jgi:hypothetical protein
MELSMHGGIVATHLRFATSFRGEGADPTSGKEPKRRERPKYPLEFINDTAKLRLIHGNAEIPGGRGTVQTGADPYQALRKQ